MVITSSARIRFALAKRPGSFPDATNTTGKPVVARSESRRPADVFGDCSERLVVENREVRLALPRLGHEVVDALAQKAAAVVLVEDVDEPVSVARMRGRR